MILIRGAGDIASGIAVRLYRCGFTLAMTDLEKPTSIRRTVCFSEAILHGAYTVEGITAERATTSEEAKAIWQRGHISVFADDAGTTLPLLQPDALVDARLAKVNLDTSLSDAPICRFTAKSFFDRIHRRDGLSRRGGDPAGPLPGPGHLRRISRAQHRRAREHRRVHRGAHHSRPQGRHLSSPPYHRRPGGC